MIQAHLLSGVNRAGGGNSVDFGGILKTGKKSMLGECFSREVKG